MALKSNFKSSRAPPKSKLSKILGQIYAFSNTISNFAGLANVVMGELLNLGPVNQIETWYPLFLVNAGALIFGTVLFYWGNYELLPWAVADTEKYKEIKYSSPMVSSLSSSNDDNMTHINSHESLK